jgi:hypothetical protein
MFCYLNVTDAGGRSHVVAQVALVPTAVAHHGLHDLNSNLNLKQKKFVLIIVIVDY